MPEGEWWKVFDTDREDLGSMVLVLKSLEGWVREEYQRWAGKGVLEREDIRRELKISAGEEIDEEEEMMRRMDERAD